ncbi:hypothetical protein ACFSQ3_08970 [Sphingobacterium corticis]|uniref:Uncharacterized protein n=1 Tax=Sphingobacterium corticis TaxID=1812823 RepID=A0ABW5NM14_9SPHI
MINIRLSTLLFGLIALQSCSKSNVSESNGDSNINISLINIEDEASFEVNPSNVEDQISRSSSNRSRSATSQMSHSNQFKIVELPEFDMIDDIQFPVSVDSTNSANSTKARTVNRASTPMSNGIQYRILMYETPTGILVANRVATAGSALNFQVNAGRTYNWYAVSINETTVPDINSSGIIPSSLLGNKDILYSSGQITPNFGNNTLTVAFRRLTSRIEVDLNTRGIFGQIQNSSEIDIGSVASGSFVKLNRIGDLNIQNATFTNLVDAPQINGGSMAVVDASLGNAVKKASFHTINTANVPAGSLRVRLNTLNITLDNTNTRTFTANTLLSITGSINPAIGSRHVITARLIESPVTINGVRWARTNLLYNSDEGVVDRYRFRPNNEYAIGDVAREFWNKGTTTPAGTTFSATYDPCNSVYPNNVWSTPTNANRVSTGAPTRNLRTTIGGNTRVMAQWDPAANTPNNPAYPRNTFELLYIGYYDNGQRVLVQQGHNQPVGGLAVAEYWQVENTGSTSSRARSEITQVTAGNYSYGAFNGATDGNRLDRKPYRCVRRPT